MIQEQVDPIARRRLASGVWSHKVESNLETGVPIESWTLDVQALRAKLDQLMRTMDYNSHQRYMANPGEFIDCYFGEGTFNGMTTWQRDGGGYQPYREKRHLPMSAIIERQRRDDAVDAMSYAMRNQERQMALNRYFNSGTTTSTSTITSGSGGDWLFYDGSRTKMFNDIIKEKAKELGVAKRDETFLFKPKHVIPNIPFKKTPGKSLLETLQDDFNSWAGQQLKYARG